MPPNSCNYSLCSTDLPFADFYLVASQYLMVSRFGLFRMKSLVFYLEKSRLGGLRRSSRRSLQCTIIQKPYFSLQATRAFSTDSERVLREMNQCFVNNNSEKFSALLEEYSNLINAPNISNDIKPFFTEKWVKNLNRKDSVSIVTSLGKLAKYGCKDENITEICSKLMEKTNKSNVRLSAAEISQFLVGLAESPVKITCLPVSLENELTNEHILSQNLKFSATELQNVLASLAKLNIKWISLSENIQDRLMKSIVIESRNLSISETSTILNSLGKIEFDVNKSIFNTTLFRIATTAISDWILIQSSSESVALQDATAQDIVNIFSGLHRIGTNYSDVPDYLSIAITTLFNSDSELLFNQFSPVQLLELVTICGQIEHFSQETRSETKAKLQTSLLSVLSTWESGTNAKDLSYILLGISSFGLKKSDLSPAFKYFLLSEVEKRISDCDAEQYSRFIYGLGRMQYRLADLSASVQDRTSTSTRKHMQLMNMDSFMNTISGVLRLSTATTAEIAVTTATGNASATTVASQRTSVFGAIYTNAELISMVLEKKLELNVYHMARLLPILQAHGIYWRNIPEAQQSELLPVIATLTGSLLEKTDALVEFYDLLEAFGLRPDQYELQWSALPVETTTNIENIILLKLKAGIKQLSKLNIMLNEEKLSNRNNNQKVKPAHRQARELSCYTILQPYGKEGSEGSEIPLPSSIYNSDIPQPTAVDNLVAILTQLTALNCMQSYLSPEITQIVEQILHHKLCFMEHNSEAFTKIVYLLGKIKYNLPYPTQRIFETEFSYCRAVMSDSDFVRLIGGFSLLSVQWSDLWLKTQNDMAKFFPILNYEDMAECMAHLPLISTQTNINTNIKELHLKLLKSYAIHAPVDAQKYNKNHEINTKIATYYEYLNVVPHGVELVTNSALGRFPILSPLSREALQAVSLTVREQQFISDISLKLSEKSPHFHVESRISGLNSGVLPVFLAVFEGDNVCAFVDVVSNTTTNSVSSSVNSNSSSSPNNSSSLNTAIKSQAPTTAGVLNNNRNSSSIPPQHKLKLFIYANNYPEIPLFTVSSDTFTDSINVDKLVSDIVATSAGMKTNHSDN